MTNLVEWLQNYDIFDSIDKIITLDLYNKHITKIPSEISNLVNLQNLYLDNNQITKIPSEIGNLVNLQYLYLYNNQIKYLPINLLKLINTDFYFSTKAIKINILKRYIIKPFKEQFYEMSKDIQNNMINLNLVNNRFDKIFCKDILFEIYQYLGYEALLVEDI